MEQLGTTAMWNGRRDESVDAARTFLRTLGIDCADESTQDTPVRYAAALRELTAGRDLDPRRHLKVAFPPVGEPTLITAVRVPFTSLCEHHLLPFTGHATVAYLPAPEARIVGISKLARIVKEYAARPQMQERIGEQVVDALTSCLDVQGAACLLRATHACMSLRGVTAPDVAIVTDHLRGVLRTDDRLREQLFTAAKR